LRLFHWVLKNVSSAPIQFTKKVRCGIASSVANPSIWVASRDGSGNSTLTKVMERMRKRKFLTKKDHGVLRNSLKKQLMTNKSKTTEGLPNN